MSMSNSLRVGQVRTTRRAAAASAASSASLVALVDLTTTSREVGMAAASAANRLAAACPLGTHRRQPISNSRWLGHTQRLLC